ncbi:pyrin-like [Pempheris klunzingeri]|uniref:pyrin-like n=1 Tax=Pempheris klunzingeri TaxID=3127111 RepID=UPI0039813B28
MLVPELLLETLEELGSDDFKTFKWYLSMKILDSCKPIPKSLLETTFRPETVSTLIDRYGEDLAVDISVAILKKMNNNKAAVELQKTRTAGSSTSSSAAAPPAPPAAAAPATMMAQEGSVIIAPSGTGGTSGSWNITINK